MNKIIKHAKSVFLQSMGFAAVLLLASALHAPAQSAGISGVNVDTNGLPSQIGPDSKTWQARSGHKITEIATGMNYWDGQKWSRSDSSFGITQDGEVAEASKVQDTVQLKANINQIGAVTVVTPDGITLRARRKITFSILQFLD